jgi:hypothetical protein
VGQGRGRKGSQKLFLRYLIRGVYDNFFFGAKFHTVVFFCKLNTIL